jgi:hypothetical protein
LVGREVAIVMEVKDSKTAASPGKWHVSADQSLLGDFEKKKPLPDMENSHFIDDLYWKWWFSIWLAG